MMCISVLCFFLLLLIPFVEGTDCPDDWIAHGDSCYLFIATKQSWQAANMACATKGAILVNINSKEEDLFVKGYLKVFDALGADIDTWNGGNDLDNEGAWEWSPRREPMNFTDWGQRSPGGGRRENCMEMNKLRHYSWDDASCNYNNTAICEREMEPINVIIG